MNDIHKSLLQEMMHPPLRSRKTRMIGFLIALPLGFFWMLHTDLPLWITIAVTALLAVLIPASFIWEIRSEKKNADFREAIKNGSYFEDEAWREKYRKYCETHDFSRVTAKTMRSDLHRHFLKPSGFVMWISYSADTLLTLMSSLVSFSLRIGSHFRKSEVNSIPSSGTFVWKDTMSLSASRFLI